MQLNVNFPKLHVVFKHVLYLAKHLEHSTKCTFHVLISDSYVFKQNSDLQHIIYLDSPHFPRSWPAIVLFTVALTEPHLGAVQIQSCANLLVPFLFFLFFSPPSIVLYFSHSLTLQSFICTYVPVDGDVKYSNTLCCLGTMHFSRWAIAAQTPMYANLHTKQPRMFSI